MGTGSGKIKTISLNVPVKTEDLKDIEIGTVVYLNGVVYTAREGVYKKVIADGEQLPAHLHEISNANFHCSPAATRTLGLIAGGECSSGGHVEDRFASSGGVGGGNGPARSVHGRARPMSEQQQPRP